MLCYIVRDDELLVFRHADYDLEHVGIQVPAGSIRHGESPEDAALREAREETGLSQFSVARKLGETIYDITPYRYEIQHRHVFHFQVHEPTERRWPSQELHDGQQPPTRLECFWIPLRGCARTPGRPGCPDRHDLRGVAAGAALVFYIEGATSCPPRARKGGHPRRLTVIHGATGSVSDLCSRRSAGRGHLLCKQGVGVSAPLDRATAGVASGV